MRERIATRVIAVSLIGGGIAGLVLALFTWLRLSTNAPVTALFSAVFVCSAWVGLGLWKETREAYRWAKILFALQVPILTIHGFAYQFYTAAMLSVAFSQQAENKLGFEFQLGSALTLQKSPELTGLVVGLNVFAIAVLIYLMKISTAVPQSSDPPGE